MKTKSSSSSRAQRSDLYLEKNKMSKKIKIAMSTISPRNDKNKPIQYQKGWVEFYKLKFKLTEAVLIPRPETELLVDEVLSFIKNTGNRDQNSQFSIHNSSFTILDIGTGSGNIAISIAKNLPKDANVKIIATEVSEKALEIAKQNAKFHGVENKIEFTVSGLLNNLNSSFIIHDSKLIIVTNLPYIPSARIPYLDSSVVDFEPHIALDGGKDGFELYRQLFKQINEKGLKPSLFLGEIDYTHGDIAKQEAKKYFPNARIEIKTDLRHKQRILYINIL